MKFTQAEINAIIKSIDDDINAGLCAPEDREELVAMVREIMEPKED